jgi:hypothetical protein
MNRAINKLAVGTASKYRTSTRQAVSLALALGSLLSANCAMAAVEHEGDSGSGQVSVEVAATVTERCGISGDATQLIQMPRIDHAATLVFPFKIDCNAPFAIGASTLHGGLLMTGGESAAAKGFAVVKQYDVSLSVDTDIDTLRSANCSARQLSVEGNGQGCEFFGTTPGQGLSSKRRTAIDRNGLVTVHWNDGDIEHGRRLAAGQFKDVITVVVGVRT